MLDLITKPIIGFDVTIVDRDEGDPDRKRLCWVNNGAGPTGEESWQNMDDCGEVILINEEIEYLDVTIIASSRSICPGDEVQLNVIATGDNGTYSYQWSSSLDNVKYNYKNPLVSPSTTAKYYIEVNNGERTITDSITITVNSLPVVHAGEDTSIVVNTTASLRGTVTGGSGSYLYSWSPADSVINSFIYNPTTKQLKKSNIFTLTATDYQTGCEGSDNVFVNITGSRLDVDVFTTEDTICEGESVTIMAMPTGGDGNYTYSWSSNPTGFNSSNAKISVSPDTTTTYTVVVNDSVNASTTIIVYSPSEPGLDDTYGCFGTPNTILTATGNNIKWYSDSILTNVIYQGNSYQPQYTQIGDYTTIVPPFEPYAAYSVGILDDIDQDGKREWGANVDTTYEGDIGKLYIFEATGDNTYELIWEKQLLAYYGIWQANWINIEEFHDIGDFDGDGQREFIVGGFKTAHGTGGAYNVMHIYEEANAARLQEHPIRSSYAKDSFQYRHPHHPQ